MSVDVSVSECLFVSTYATVTISFCEQMYPLKDSPTFYCTLTTPLLCPWEELFGKIKYCSVFSPSGGTRNDHYILRYHMPIQLYFTFEKEWDVAAVLVKPARYRMTDSTVCVCVCVRLLTFPLVGSSAGWCVAGASGLAVGLWCGALPQP